MDRPFYLALLAEACVRGGRVQAAASALDEAFAMVRSSRTYFYESELYRLRASVLMKAGAESHREVDTCLRQALESATRYGTRALELRATVNLARFWRDYSKDRDSLNLLAETYGKFTEGFDTADLVEANAILTDTGEER